MIFFSFNCDCVSITIRQRKEKEMADIVIVYWSGTGNTEIMAKAIKEGIESEGGDVLLKSVEQATLDDVKQAQALILGSPSMGAEELAEEIDDFLTQIEEAGIKDKVAAVFGSYDWGDGEWMGNFVKRLKDDGFKVIGDGLIINLAPDEEGLQQCKEFGKMILEKI